MTASQIESLTPGFPTPLPRTEERTAVDDPLELARFTRWEPATKGPGRFGVSSLQLSGLHCAACASLIEQALAEVPGVLEARVNAVAQRATVRWDSGRTRMSVLLQAIQRAGYGAAPDAAVPAREMRRQEQRRVIWRLFVSGFLAMQVMMMATPSYLADRAELSADLSQLLNWGSWVLSIPVLAFAGAPFFQSAWQALRKRRVGMDVPVALGLAVTFAVSTLATFDPAGPWGHEVYFDSLTMFMTFLWLGRFLDMRSRHNAAQALEEALSERPLAALIVNADGSTREIAVGRLQAGDTVRVVAGGVVPADGFLVSQAAGVAEALLTGESQPVAKRAGDTLLAGSMNAVAPLDMRVTRVGADTRQDAIVALMREALTQRPGASRWADRMAAPFLLAVLVLAAGSGLAWWFIDPSRAVWVMVSVLIVTCPCALSLATPATLVAAAGGLARQGVLLRNLDALQPLDETDLLFLDKTGTLTLDRPALQHTTLSAAQPEVRDENAAIRQAAALASWSSHPFSQALTEAAQRLPSSVVAASPVFDQVQEFPGQGLSGRDPTQALWRLGSWAWACRAEPPLAGNAAPASSSWLSREGRPVAHFQFAEQLREGALATVQQLQKQGLDLIMLSGDRRESAQSLAFQLGLSQVLAGADPETKLRTVQQAQDKGRRVGMVGDGLNDGPVMAAADVSIAMGHGALAAREGADVVITSGRITALVSLRNTARRSMQVVRQNLAWAAAYNAACIPLAVTGWLPPWAAGLGMALSSLAVMWNAQRAGRVRPG